MGRVSDGRTGRFRRVFRQGGSIGHSYFLSDPAVKADLVALIRDRVKAGDPRRQLVEIKRPFWRISDVQQASR